MSGFALHPEAFTDLDDIREFIAKGNPGAADRVITEIFDTLRALARFPHQGHRRPDLTSRPLRFKLVRDYLIAYAPDEPFVGDCRIARAPQPPCDGGDSKRQGKPVATVNRPATGRGLFTSTKNQAHEGAERGYALPV